MPSVCRQRCPCGASPAVRVSRRSFWQMGARVRHSATQGAGNDPATGGISAGTGGGGHAGGAGGAGGSGGAGVLLLPGFLSGSRQYSALVADLRRRGFKAEVVPMSFTDWVPVLSGGSFEWYLQRLDAVLQSMYARHGQVALVGHSAGGWIARLLLGSEPYQGVRYRRAGWVHTLLTLGTPHHSREEYPFGRAEEALAGPFLEHAPPGVSGSSLRLTNYLYPDAASLGGPRVVCACGNTIRGHLLWGSGSGRGGAGSNSTDNGIIAGTGAATLTREYSASEADSSSSSSSGSGNSSSYYRPSRWDAYIAYESYKSGCGRGDVDGDGVTPLCISQVHGAEALILPGVWHAPRGRAEQPWYGDVIDCWQQYLVAPGQPFGCSTTVQPQASWGQ